MSVDPENQGNLVPSEMPIEEWTLRTLGYEGFLDQEFGGYGVVGRNFLDAYGASPHRQNTEDLLEGFRDMDETDPDYEGMKEYILRFLRTQIGPLTAEDGDKT